MPSRKSLRSSIRAQRRALTEQQLSDYANQFADHVCKSRLFLNSQRIAFYIANDGELDPSILMELAWAMGKDVYLPIVTETHDKRLWFAPHEPDQPMVANQFGIPEPDVSPRTWIKARLLDLVIMPLVAFDRKGNRLGMGAGFYDRTLAFLKNRQKWIKPRLLGIGYSFQQQKSIDHQPWDVPLAYVATEHELFKV